MGFNSGFKGLRMKTVECRISSLAFYDAKYFTLKKIGTKFLDITEM